MDMSIGLMVVAVVVLTLSSAFSFRYREVGLYGAIVAIIFGFFASSSFHYGAFILAIGLINLISLEALKSEIKGVDYGLVGLMCLVTLYIFNTNDLTMLLLALVLVSVPTYILVMLREGGANVEIGMKYIVFMVLATILFLIGAVMLVYASSLGGIFYVLGYVMLILGLSLEVGVAPLHEWVPDVFSSADPIPISIIASLAKIVPFVAAMRILISTYNPSMASIVVFTAFIAAISMLMGNIGALTSKEHARVLAYSTVANMGYVLACMVAVIKPEYFYFALTGGLLMLFANASGKIGFFNAIKAEGAYSPFMYILALSFIGVPPLMGFWGKLFILYSLVEVGYIWLAALLVLNSAISIPYYIRLGRELGVSWKATFTNLIVTLVTIITLITIIPPDWFYEGMKVLSQTIGIVIP